MTLNSSIKMNDSEEGISESIHCGVLQESLLFENFDDAGSLIFDDLEDERGASTAGSSRGDRQHEETDDSDSLLQAAALVSIESNERRNLPPFSHQERLAILIAVACVLIILPAMLAPTLLSLNEPRFARCSSHAHCDASERCVPDGLDRKLVCCPRAFIETAQIFDAYNVVCGNFPTGSKCGRFDSLCASGYCIDGNCAERALRNLEPCTTEYHCEEGLTCQYRSYDDTRKVCCNGSNAGICNGMPVGTTCDQGDRCKTNLCIFGICASDKLPDSYKCEKDGDCFSGSCAGDAVGSSSKVCCKRPYHISGWSSVCGDRKTGTFCREINEICSSGFCINQHCAARQLNAGDECKESADCLSNACALEDADLLKPLVCCEHSETVQFYKNNRHHSVCGQRSRGTFCGDFDDLCQSGLCIGNHCVDSRLKDLDLCSKDNDCENNACALSSPTSQANLVCCPSGSTTRLSLQDNVYSTWSRVCSKMPVGTHCGNSDEVCQSGFCINSRCALDGLDEFESCTEAADCKSKACALSDANGVNSTNVCCETSKTVMGAVQTNESVTKYRRLCTNRPVGTYCKESDDMCDSGLCINGFCASNRLDDLERCTENNHCKSSVCSLSYASSDAPNVCCKNGVAVTGAPTDTSWSAKVCAGLLAGTICSNIEAACESGFCINGTCALRGLGPDESCLESSDCATRACARKDARASSPDVCCNLTSTVIGELSGSSPNEWGRVCSGQPEGTFCNEINSMCAEGLCINGNCATTTLEEFSPCSEDSDCNNGACSLSFADTSAPKICCPGGRRNSGYVLGGAPYHHQTFAQVCSGLPDGTFCTFGSMCASQMCINKSCSSESLVPSTNPTVLDSSLLSLSPSAFDSEVPSAKPTTVYYNDRTKSS